MSINEAVDQQSIDNIDAWEASHSEKNLEFYPPLERIERKLDAIIDWINWFAKENRISGGYEPRVFEGSFKTLPTIDIEDCERRDKDSE